MNEDELDAALTEALAALPPDDGDLGGFATAAAAALAAAEDQLSAAAGREAAALGQEEALGGEGADAARQLQEQQQKLVEISDGAAASAATLATAAEDLQGAGDAAVLNRLAALATERNALEALQGLEAAAAEVDAALRRGDPSAGAAALEVLAAAAAAKGGCGSEVLRLHALGLLKDRSALVAAFLEQRSLDGLVSRRWPLRAAPWQPEDLRELQGCFRDLTAARRWERQGDAATPQLAPVAVLTHLVEAHFTHNFGNGTVADRWAARPAWPFRYLERLLDALLEAANALVAPLLPQEDLPSLEQAVVREICRLAAGHALGALRRAAHSDVQTSRVVSAVLEFDAALERRGLGLAGVRRPAELLAATPQRLDRWIALDKAVIREQFHAARASMGGWELDYDAVVRRVASADAEPKENLPLLPPVAATFAHLWASASGRFARLPSAVKRARFVKDILKPLLYTLHEAALRTARAYQTGQTWASLQGDLNESDPADELTMGEAATAGSIFGETADLATHTGLGVTLGYDDLKTASLIHRYGIVNMLSWVQRMLRIRHRDLSYLQMQAALEEGAPEDWDAMPHTDGGGPQGEDDGLIGMVVGVMKSMESGGANGPVFRKELEVFRDAAAAVLKDIKNATRDEFRDFFVRHNRLSSRLPEAAAQQPCQALLAQALRAAAAHARAASVLSDAADFRAELLRVLLNLARDVEDDEWKAGMRALLG